MIEILAQARNPHALQPYLAKCFDAVTKLEFAQEGNIICFFIYLYSVYKCLYKIISVKNYIVFGTFDDRAMLKLGCKEIQCLVVVATSHNMISFL